MRILKRLIRGHVGGHKYLHETHISTDGGIWMPPGKDVDNVEKCKHGLHSGILKVPEAVGWTVDCYNKAKGNSQ